MSRISILDKLAQTGDGLDIRREDRRDCKECGEPFPSNYRGEYCSDCYGILSKHIHNQQVSDEEYAALEERKRRNRGGGDDMGRMSILDRMIAADDDEEKDKKDDGGGEKSERKPTPPSRTPAVEDEPDVVDEPPMEDGIEMTILSPLDDDEVGGLGDPMDNGPGESILDDLLGPKKDDKKEGPPGLGDEGPDKPPAMGGPNDVPLDEDDISMLTRGLQRVIQEEELDSEERTRTTKLLDSLEGFDGPVKIVIEDNGDDEGGDDEVGKLPDTPSIPGPSSDVGNDAIGRPSHASLLDRLV